MSNWSSSHQRQIRADNQRRRDRFLWAPLTFILGWACSLVFNQWVAPLLPGPRAEVVVRGLREAGNAAGCTSYIVTLVTDQEIDSAYVRISFPQNIKDAQVGFSAQTQIMSLQAWETGRNPGGECAIIRSAVNINEGVSGVAVANVLTFRTSRIAAHAPVEGIVIVPTFDRATNSTDPIFEGNYDYTKWGLTLKRRLKFHYTGPPEQNQN